jgi:hypothetical protein
LQFGITFLSAYTGDGGVRHLFFSVYPHFLAYFESFF